MTNENSGVQSLQWTGESLKVLDQRQLPEKIIFDEYTSAQGVAEAIRTMRVRGAPAIGIAAAYGVVLSVMAHCSEAHLEWLSTVQNDIAVLAASRPTAVNLFWALDKMQTVLQTVSGQPVQKALDCAKQIHAEDIAANRKMGELGADIVGAAKGVLTHCNTGALATGGYGTALGVIRSVYARQPLAIYAGETRPWLQGQRLTVWELAQDKIPVTLIADSAAAWLMRSGVIQWIIVGADRIALNGDVANKIGTYSLAVLARQHGVKFMVVAPTSTIDGNMLTGAEIEIEQRQSSELLPGCYEANTQVTAWNPVFDVTPATLINAIVTECGVVLDPVNTGVGHLLTA